MFSYSVAEQSDSYLNGSKLSTGCCFVFSSRPLETGPRRLITTTSGSPSSTVKKESFILKALSKLP